MRLISLNIWRGKLLDPLLNFLNREAAGTDLFCFQEMVNPLGNLAKEVDVFSAVAKALPAFQGFFEVTQDEKGGLEMGLAAFIKKTDAIDKEGDFFVYKTRNAMVGDDGRTLGKNLQFIQFPKPGEELTVVNFHGIWTGDGRGDTKDRLELSKKFKGFLDMVGGTKIVCGDFNLTRDAKSLAIIDGGMRNLVKEFGATSTRSHFFPYSDKFCDYIIVDKIVKVNDFRVLQEEVSDHLPLLLDFS